MDYTSSIKKLLDESTSNTQKKTSKIPNEYQYDMAGAYSMVAYKNQEEGSYSDLDIAKINFENKYKLFLTLYGQYSNAPLRQHPSNQVLPYPIGNDTPVFKSYPNLKPNNIQ